MAVHEDGIDDGRLPYGSERLLRAIERLMLFLHTTDTSVAKRKELASLIKGGNRGPDTQIVCAFFAAAHLEYLPSLVEGCLVPPTMCSDMDNLAEACGAGVLCTRFNPSGVWKCTFVQNDTGAFLADRIIIICANRDCTRLSISVEEGCFGSFEQPPPRTKDQIEAGEWRVHC